MLLYNLAFANADICGEKELYFRGGERRDNGLFVKSGEVVSFDTYFNCFSHVKYKKYTNVNEVTLKLYTQGKGVVCIYLYAKDGIKLLSETRFDGNVEIKTDISRLPDDGFIYFNLEASEDCLIKSGGWHAECETKNVKIGLVICTYRREQYLKRNLTAITEYMKSLTERFFDVYVIDNGQTISENFGDGVTVIPNENTGGSGGFTRGIKEVVKGDYTHFLLMDDDILFDVQTIYRTYSLLRVLKEDYGDASVGGAMLVLDRPYLQEEMGAVWTGNSIKSQNSRLDARKQETLYLNETLCEPDYNAWFYMCMPVSAPEKYGYPLPFFIRCDDIEYGLRACENIITTSGISVWHEGFDVKYSAGIEYYIKRNELITSARFPRKKGAFANFKKLVLAVGSELMQQRYYAVKLVFKAYEDFYKGADYFMSLDCAKKHREIRALCPEFIGDEEIKIKYGINVDLARVEKHGKWSFKNFITLNGYLIPKCFYKKETAQVDMINFEYDDFFAKRRVLQYNPAAKVGFVTEIKKSELFKAWGKLVKFLFVTLFKYRKTAKGYAKIEN